MGPMSVLLQRTRASGKCPLSLLTEDRVYTVDDFDVLVLRLLTPMGFVLRSDDSAANDFAFLLQGLQNIGALPGHVPQESRRKVLEYRRAILLALVAGTPSNNPALVAACMQYMTSVRIWLEETLSNMTGSIDFLLHLLSSIEHLPVTKASIKDSGLGKAVGIVEKHKICKGSPHETAIVQRVERIKQAWHARVKSQKIHEATAVTKSSETNVLKRSIGPSASTPATVKKLKPTPVAEEKKTAVTTEDKKVSSLSSLLKKVSAPASNTVSAVATASVAKASTVNVGSDKTNIDAAIPNGASVMTKKVEKKNGRRVKWADHFGGKLGISQDDENDDSEAQQTDDTNVSWSDRKRRDRLREKELLSKAKKAKLDDDGDDDGIDLSKSMKAVVPWTTPLPLQDRPDISKAVLESQELISESQRSRSVMQAHYLLDENVPSNPTPIPASEEGELSSESPDAVTEIPFFVPQTLIVSEPVTVAATLYTPILQPYPAPAAPFSNVAIPSQYDNIASAEFLQSLGLPMFLIGQSKSAVQTLAASPGLLSTLVDSQGLYDQPRLLNLVQTLSASTGDAMQRPTQPPPVLPMPYQPPMPTYNAPIPAQNYMNEKAPSYQPVVPPKPKAYPSSGGTRLVVDKSVEGNLHISGFGVGTTDADIIATFSPYVRIDEIVMKGTYAFVNSNDPPAAARAREALQGTHIRGAPITIKQATRKQKDPGSSAGPYGPSQQSMHSIPGPVYGNQIPSGSVPPPTQHQTPHIPPTSNSMPPYGIMDVDSVRDDRGNPATKNLFIAGYGQSTTEQQLRDLVAQFVPVVGVVLKGTFSFVNTADREAAVHVRNMLSGTMLNGGLIRINFAKESGRLGTSFDLTYGPNTGPNALRNPAATPQMSRPQEAAMSYYGRGY